LGYLTLSKAFYKVPYGRNKKWQAGDYINIPAFKKHKVSWTLPNQESIWLAVHY